MIDRRKIVVLIALAVCTCMSLYVSATVERKIDAKETAAIFKSIGDWFKDTETYSLNVEFISYTAHDASVPHEIKTGFLKKSGRSFHSNMMGTEIIQNEMYQVIIDTTNDFIAVKDAEQTIWDNINPVIMEKGVGTAQSVYLNELKDSYLLKMIPNKSSSINYYEINYDKLYRIKNVVLKMTKYDYKEDGKTQIPIYPKVNIRFYNYSNKIEVSATEFQTASYLNMAENPIKAVGKYAALKVLDLRVKEKIKK